jgi:hypothetical protein
MKRFTFAMVLVCALAPATARANSGGFWEFLYGQDPKLTGFGADFHLTCHRPGGQSIKHCEEWFGASPNKTPEVFKDLAHEINFRVAYYFEYDESYSSDQIRFAADPFNAHRMHVVKYMPMYVYRPGSDKHLAVAVGLGGLLYWGSTQPDKNQDPVPFNTFSKLIVTPLSLTYAPTTMNCGAKCLWLKDFFIRGEASYIVHGISPYDFDNSLPKIDRAGEWNVGLAVGYDLRRRRFDK